MGVWDLNDIFFEIKNKLSNVITTERRKLENFSGIPTGLFGRKTPLYTSWILETKVLFFSEQLKENKFTHSPAIQRTHEFQYSQHA
jgi:hypothetical protein